MPGAFALAAAALHNDPNLSTAAVYTLPNGASLPVRVIEVSLEWEGAPSGTHIREDATMFEVLMSAVPERPIEWTEGVQGACVSVGPVTYQIFGVSRSNTRRDAWLLYGQKA